MEIGATPQATLRISSPVSGSNCRMPPSAFVVTQSDPPAVAAFHGSGAAWKVTASELVVGSKPYTPSVVASHTRSRPTANPWMVLAV